MSVPAPEHAKRTPEPILVPLLLGGIALIVFAIQAFDLINCTVDDVFIVLRVVKNVIHGDGFVYNVGQQIEGYSDWLWLVLLLGPVSFAASFSGSPWDAMWIAKGLSALFGLATIVLIFVVALRLMKDRPDRRSWAALASLGLAASTPFVVWSIGGLETTFIAFLFLLALYLVSRIDQYRVESGRGVGSPISLVVLGVVLGLTVLTRPEAPLDAALLVLALLVLYKWKLIEIALVIIPLLLISGGFLLWRWETYHALLPNTFYAKTGGAAGGIIVGMKYYLASIAAILGPLVLFFPVALVGKRSGSRVVPGALVFIVASTVFTLYTRGDWMPAYRFMVPVAPMMILVAVRGLAMAYDALIVAMGGRARFKLVVWAMLALVPFASIFAARTMVRGEMGGLSSGFAELPGHSLQAHQRVAEWIDSSYRGRSIRVAAGEAGLIGYLNPRMTLIDCGGLMDTTISRMHRRGVPFDANYILAQHPDLILTYGIRGHPTGETRAEAQTDYSKALRAAPQFESLYALKVEISPFQIYSLKGDSGVSAQIH